MQLAEDEAVVACFATRLRNRAGLQIYPRGKAVEGIKLLSSYQIADRI